MKKAFTLGEVLVTLAIVGLIAALILPGLIKDTHNKANMVLLKKTVGEIQTVMDKDILNNGTNYNNWNLYKNPETFLKELDTVKIKTNAKPLWYPGSYKTLTGGTNDSFANDTATASAVLKNGVGIAIFTNGLTSFESFTICIDLTGEEAPNIIGVDAFQYSIPIKDNLDIYAQVGVLRTTNTAKIADLKTSCKGNSGEVACTRLVELSGYDPNYMNTKETNPEEDD